MVSARMAPNPFYVEPGMVDIGSSPLVGVASQMIEEKRRQEAEKEAQVQRMKIFNQAKQAYRSGDMDMYTDLMIENPGMADALSGAMNFRNEATKKNAISAVRSAMDGDYSGLENRPEVVRMLGGDPSDTEAFIQKMQTMTPEEVQKDLYPMYAALASDEAKAWKEVNPDIFPKQEEALKIGAQEILEDGTVIQSTPQGVRVFDPAGQRVTGGAAANAIRKARAQAVENQRAIYGARRSGTLGADIEMGGVAKGTEEAAKQAIKLSGEAWEDLNKIDTNISNIDSAINAIDKGADTGFVESYLPSIKQASVELDNLRGKMGLDIVGATTFGSLSESELKFALDTALPEKMQEDDLKKWLIKKRNAQNKMRRTLSAYASHLATPGNSLKTWMELHGGKGTKELSQEGGAKPVTDMSDDELFKLIGQ